jgi:hypothetical protein
VFSPAGGEFFEMDLTHEDALLLAWQQGISQGLSARAGEAGQIVQPGNEFLI